MCTAEIDTYSLTYDLGVDELPTYYTKPSNVIMGYSGGKIKETLTGLLGDMDFENLEW